MLVCMIAPAACANNPKTWNYDTGLDYLFLSYATYCPSDTLQNWSCKWCSQSSGVAKFQPYSFPSDFRTNTFGVVGYNPAWNQIVIAFRGSHNIRNWIVDLNFSKMKPYKNYTNVEVHEGFNNAWNALSPQVLNSAFDLMARYPSASVVVTGHSLGAALATLCALELYSVTSSFASPPQIYVWNYGCPRVGNQAFSDLYKLAIRTHFRHVNNRDIVAHNPPMAMGFYHCPTEVWERGTLPSSFKVCDESGEDPTCSDSLAVTLSVDDHMNYFGFYEECK